MPIFDRFLRGEPSSATKAKERLKFVLIHDRANLSPGQLESLKDEIIRVISKYVEIDYHLVEISLTRDRNSQRLVADIPLAPPSARRR